MALTLPELLYSHSLTSWQTPDPNRSRDGALLGLVGGLVGLEVAVDLPVLDVDPVLAEGLLDALQPAVLGRGRRDAKSAVLDGQISAQEVCVGVGAFWNYKTKVIGALG